MGIFNRSPLEYAGAKQSQPLRLFRYNRAPTSADYVNFKIGDEWLDHSSDDWYKMCDRTATAGLWCRIGGSGGPVETFDTDSGAVIPNAANLVNVFGTAAQGLTTSGSGNTIAITVADSTTTAKGVVELATDAESIGGVDTTRPIVASSLAAKLGSQTNHGIPIGATPTGAFNWTGAPTNGQLLIGSTGVDPVLATLTAGSGISIANGAGSITIATADGIAWEEISDATKTMEVDKGYICNRGGGVTFTLPAVAAQGDRIRIAGKSGIWVIAQPVGVTVHYGVNDTTTGVGGSLTASHARNCVELLCETANTDWVVLSGIGNLLVV